jgi:hypothetical protein
VTITNRVSLKSVMSGNTPIADVVDAPTIGAATAGIESATVAYTAAATGGTATSFTAISTPGSLTGTGASPITVSGLTGGTAYTFKVYGTNASGVWSGVQSAASSSVTPAVATAYESIASATGTGSSGTITFSSIPSTYQHLQLRVISRSTSASSSGEALNLRLGAGSIDTGANYARHYIYGEGTTVAAAGSASASTIQMITSVAGGGATSGIQGVTIIDIHDYASTTKYKTVRAFTGVDFNNANGALALVSGLWMSTSAVGTLRLYHNTDSFTTGSTFALYGIKGA